MSDFDMEEPQVQGPQLPAEAAQAAPAEAARNSFKEAAARLVDMRGVARPPTFNGASEAWGEFRFRLESLAGLLSLDVGMKKARTCSLEELALEVDDEDEATRSRLLYNLLVQICGGRASTLLRLLPRGNGWLAWRKLCDEYEPSVTSRHLSMLVGVLTPQWDESTAFTDQLMRWEKSLKEYEATTGESVPDPVKCAMVARWAPERIRAWIRTAPTEVLSSPRMMS